VIRITFLLEKKREYELCDALWFMCCRRRLKLPSLFAAKTFKAKIFKKEGANMNSQVQHNFAAHCSNASALIQIDEPDVRVLSGNQSHSTVMERMRLLELRGEGLRFARGSMAGIGLEIFAAICLYAIWHIGHLFR
jgi:hypothetical protein